MSNITKLCEILSETPVCADGVLAIRRLTRSLEADGTYLNTVTFHDPITDADIGTPAVIGDASTCGASLVEELVFCDPDSGDIIIRVVNELTGVVSWVDIDGNIVTPAGTPGLCDLDEDHEVRVRTLCHTDGDVLTTVSEIVIYVDGAETSTTIIDGAGVVFPITGTLTVGACPIPAVDVIQREICLDVAGVAESGVEIRGVSEADGTIIWTRFIGDISGDLGAAGVVQNDAACCC